MKHLFTELCTYADDQSIDKFRDDIVNTIFPIVLQWHKEGYSEPEIMYFLNNILSYHFTLYHLDKKIEQMGKGKKS